MLFHSFPSQEVRRKFGGSYFMELQYCRLAQGTGTGRIVSVDAVEHWKDDSLYIYGDDEDRFISHYGGIFTGGLYNNGESGAVDTCGINYYPRERALLVAKAVKEAKPPDAQALLEWLEKGQDYNGFYVLGL